MIYPVTVLTPEGEVKKVISTEVLSKEYWKEIIEVRDDICIPEDPKAKKKYPRIPKVCAIWARPCLREDCSNFKIHRSITGQYCSNKCGKKSRNERSAKVRNKGKYTPRKETKCT